MSASASSGSSTGGLGDLLGLLGPSNPLAQAARSIGQLQKGVDDLLLLVEQFGSTMEQMNRIASRVNNLLDDVEPPIRALMPQVTRTLKAGDLIVERMGSAVDLLGDVGKALQPLAQFAESAGMFGLKPLSSLRDNAAGAADLVRRVTQFASAEPAAATRAQAATTTPSGAPTPKKAAPKKAAPTATTKKAGTKKAGATKAGTKNAGTTKAAPKK